ncbi:MAG: DUF929 domain-containing protein [Thermoplasmata archaeon]|nr:DUF929 domain-containing protein [Thermoplasmata archaeon]
MVDWDTVERRRSRGWDWDRIASDPRVDFHAEEGAGDPGRALRAMYYQRRSKSRRVPSASERGDGSDLAPEKRWNLVRVAALLAPMFAAWFVLALVFPSPVGAFLSAIPVLVILMLLSIALLGFALLRTADRWTTGVRNSLVVGAVLGLVLAGIFGLAAVVSGCPTLTATTSPEPSNFVVVANPLWADSGIPVFFFYGSIACPYCAASSWAMAVALEQFGTLSGTHFDRSSPTDAAGPSTPEVVLAGATLQSRWVSLHVAESTDNQTITAAPTSGCVESAYVSAYDPGGSIPFLVIGGQYLHVGALVAPAKLAGLTPAQVQAQIANQSGPAWDAISPIAFLLEAFLVKVNGGQPASVATNSSVANWLGQIH